MAEFAGTSPDTGALSVTVVVTPEAPDAVVTFCAVAPAGMLGPETGIPTPIPNVMTVPSGTSPVTAAVSVTFVAATVWTWAPGAMLAPLTDMPGVTPLTAAALAKVSV